MSVKKRRDFLNILLGSTTAATVASVFYPIIRFVMPPPVSESADLSVSAARLDDIPANSGKIFKFGANPGILIHTAQGDWRAFSARCTHLNCTVSFDPDQRLIICACHNGVFDLEGRNAGGPPPRPLDAYSVNVRGDEVIVSRV
jgi:Rieske Fe-S protein